MFLRTFTAVASFTAFSSAILLPPTISSENSDIITTLPFDIASHADGQVIKLDCPGCPVPVGKTDNGLTLMTTRLDSELLLDFEINHLKAADVLTLNGVQIFPISRTFNAESLSALQTITTPKIDSEAKADQVQASLGYEAHIKLVKAPTENEQLALFSARIQVVEVGGAWVDGLDAICLKLIATPAGGLLIADIAKTSSTSPVRVSGGKCNTMICKFKQILSGKLSQIKPSMAKFGKGKGCGGKGKAKGMPVPINRHGQGGQRNGLDDFGHHGHGHPRPSQRIHRFLHYMKSIAVQVLIPVSIGIACGTAASIVGMAVGHIIVFLWRAFYRRGQSSTYVSVEPHKSKAHDSIKSPPAYREEDILILEEKGSDL